MALSHTSYAIEAGSLVVNSVVTSTSRTYNSGDLVLALYSSDGNDSSTSNTISNTGTAQTWTQLPRSTTSVNVCGVTGWFCVMSVTQAMTITCNQSSGFSHTAQIAVVAMTGQHATTPVPAGNRFSGTFTTDASQSITPTSVGSYLWMWVGDWSQTNTFAPIANCTMERVLDDPGRQTTALFRPTTSPRTDTASFTIGETDTSGLIDWIAFEVQGAPVVTVPTLSAATAISITATTAVPRVTVTF